MHDLTHDGQHWGADVSPIPKLWAICWDFLTTLKRHVTSLNHLAFPPRKCRKYRGSLRKPGPARALFRIPNPEPRSLKQVNLVKVQLLWPHLLAAADAGYLAS